MTPRVPAAVVSAATLLVIPGGVAIPGGQLLEADGVHVLVSPPTRGWNDAALSGRGQVVDECLALGREVVIWPPGTVIASRSPLRISVPHVGVVSVGDELSGGGGLAGRELDDVERPRSCVSQTFVTFWPDGRLRPARARAR